MKTVRLYGLFEMVDGHWMRVYIGLEYPIETARRVFQDALLSGAMSGVKRELRTVGSTSIPTKSDKRMIARELGLSDEEIDL